MALRGGRGPAAYDSSGHGAEATIGGGAVRTVVPGGHALAFDGGGHVVARGPVVRTDEAFTIAAWVRLDETHLAAFHDPADRRVCLYVDGTLEACRTRAFLTRANGPLDIGRALQDGRPVDGWHGAIDDVRVFARVLTPAQIGDVVAHRA